MSLSNGDFCWLSTIESVGTIWKRKLDFFCQLPFPITNCINFFPLNPNCTLGRLNVAFMIIIVLSAFAFVASQNNSMLIAFF